MSDAKQTAGRRAVEDIDELYLETDRLYYEFARGCGLSDCPFWILYGIEVMGGSAAQAALVERFSYSKQTVNSALKTLEGRGFVSLGYVEGSRKSKLVSLTPEGRDFCDRYIVPAIEAEDRAFMSLGEKDRTELVRLINLYTRAIERELTNTERGEEQR